MNDRTSTSEGSKNGLILGGYFTSMQDEDAKKRHLEKLDVTGGIDPYETKKKEWKDDVDLWPSITHINFAIICWRLLVRTMGMTF